MSNVERAALIVGSVACAARSAVIKSPDWAVADSAINPQMAKRRSCGPYVLVRAVVRAKQGLSAARISEAIRRRFKSAPSRCLFFSAFAPR